jgi:hypothetical protein
MTRSARLCRSLGRPQAWARTRASPQRTTFIRGLFCRRGPVSSPPRASAIPAAGQCHPRGGQPSSAGSPAGAGGGAWRCPLADAAATCGRAGMQAYAEQVGGLLADTKAAALALIDEVSAEYPTGAPPRLRCRSRVQGCFCMCLWRRDGVGQGARMQGTPRMNGCVCAKASESAAGHRLGCASLRHGSLLHRTGMAAHTAR